MGRRETKAGRCRPVAEGASPLRHQRTGTPSHVRTAAATRGEADLKLMRAVIGFLGGWATCTKACRRARRCASPSVACFDENLESIRDQLEELAAWPRLDGPREPADLARPVVELFD
jgi:hypothetical protein